MWATKNTCYFGAQIEYVFQLLKIFLKYDTDGRLFSHLLNK